MGVPRQKRTKSHRNQRRMHVYTKSPSTSLCPKCGKPILPHIVCPSCGSYKGREVLNVLAKLAKREKKKKAKE